MNGCEDVGPWAGRPRAEMMKSDEVEAMLHHCCPTDFQMKAA